MEKDFQLGEWIVRPALNRLESGTRTVAVEPRVMDLLVYLFSHAGEVLSKDQIIHDVWGGAFVTDQALTYAVTELRRALGDDAHAPRFVRTVPKRGYQLISDVSDTPAGATAALTEPTGRWFGAKRGRVVLVALAILLLTIGYVFVDRLTTEKAVQPSIAQLTFGEGLQTHATWSPDGRFVAFAWNRDGNFDLFIQALDGSEPIRLTDHPADDTQPSWSPDGREIVFRSEREAGGLFIVPAFGGPVRRICSFGWRPAWSPDGKTILFLTSPDSSGHHQIYLTDREAATPRRFAQRFTNKDACWHPSGNYISVWGLDTQTLYVGLHLIPVGGGSPKWADWRFAAETMIRAEREIKLTMIRWAPEGDQLYYAANSEGVSSIWRVTIDPDRFEWGSKPERLTRGAQLDTDIAVSPSGQRLAFTSQVQRSRTWLYPFDTATASLTGEGRRVGRSELNVLECELSRQGDQLLLIGMKGAAFSATLDQEIWQMTLTGRQQLLPIDTDGGLILNPTWSRDGKYFVYRKGRVYDKQGNRVPWGDLSVVMQSSGGGSKRILSQATSRHFTPEDWSRDGRWLLCTTRDEEADTPQVSKLLSTDGSQLSSRVLLSHSDYDIVSPRFSPDDRWICFVAVSRKDSRIAHLYLAPASGGKWIPMIPEERNVDQIHWSLDGCLIYCVAKREAGAVLLAVPVDPHYGRPSGAPREVMSLDQFASLPEDIGGVRFCVAPGQLIVQKIERAGNIWMTTTRPD